MANKGDLKIWHIPQIPGKAFEVPVSSVEEAAKLLVVLAKYDMFQLLENVKPDYSNVQGLMIFDGEKWGDWYDEEEQGVMYDDMNDWMEQHKSWSLLDGQYYWIEANKTRRY